MTTEELIAQLAAEARTPVRPLPPPPRRVLRWLVLSVPWVALVILVMGPRPDLAQKFGDGRWLIAQGAALVTAVMAAMAAFCSGVPGRPRWEHAMPIAPALIWTATLGAGCLQDWIVAGPGGLSFEPDWACLPGIVIVGFVPGLTMAVMLRRIAPLAPMTAVGLGGLAAAALADFGLRLFHAQDASLMVLVWQVGTVALLTALSGAVGRRLLRWRHVTAS